MQKQTLQLHMWLWWVVGDIVTTWIGLTAGAVEINPVAAVMFNLGVHGWIIMILAKIGTLTVITRLPNIVYIKPWIVKLSYIIVIVIGVLVTVNNSVVALQQLIA